jgi:hypothetical protein
MTRLELLRAPKYAVVPQLRTTALDSQLPSKAIEFKFDQHLLLIINQGISQIQLNFPYFLLAVISNRIFFNVPLKEQLLIKSIPSATLDFGNP